MKTKDADVKKQVDHYMSLPYTVTLAPCDDGHSIYYFARVVKLPGLMMTGATPEEALTELESVKREWMETYLQLGNKMPEPLPARNFSGKVVLRMPPSLHQTLVTIAELEGVSFNQYMVSTLSRAAGRDEVLIRERKSSYKSGKRPARKSIDKTS